MQPAVFPSPAAPAVPAVSKIPPAPALPPLAPQGRLVSLDALRGFNMMWIVGAASLVNALSQLRGGPALRVITEQLTHTKWEGFHFYDLILPLFVFMAGVSVPFSLKRLDAEQGRRAVWLRVGRRVLLLFALGVFYNGGLANGFAGVRWLGVLQRIALCYGVTSLLFVHARPRTLVAILVALLAGYWALLTFVPVPGAGSVPAAGAATNFSEGHNWANWLDAHFLPGRRYDGDHDPEGLLSTLPAIATCMIGMFAGRLLRDAARPPARKALLLAAAGAAALAAGLLWGMQFPIIKKIWTSTYVLVAAGWSLLLLSAFYWAIDVRRWRPGVMPLVWMGTNAITIYLACNIIDFKKLAQRVAGGDISKWLDICWPGLGGVAVAALGIALSFWLCRFLYKRGIFLRA